MRQIDDDVKLGLSKAAVRKAVNQATASYAMACAGAYRMLITPIFGINGRAIDQQLVPGSEISYVPAQD